MNRWDVINFLIDTNQYNRYLEIGYGTGLNFHNIVLKDKTSVDIGHGVNQGDSFCQYLMPSSEFFEMARGNKFDKYDIVFIDGSHTAKDVKEDITNSLEFLADKGTIVVHDCNPIKYEHQTVPGTDPSHWNGDVWKAFLSFRSSREDLFMCVVDTDEGCGIVQRGRQNLFPTLAEELITYSYLEENRKELLNLISVEEFLES